MGHARTMPTCEINGITLHYERMGTGPPLLLLHGLGSCARDWEGQTDAFAEHYDVVAPDLRGHGRSDKPPGPYSIPLFTADVAAFIDHLQLGPMHVVGLSMGGMVAFQLALDAPGLVASLTAVNSPPDLRLNTWHRRWRFHQRRWMVRALGMWSVGRYLARRLFPAPEQAALRARLVARIAANDRRAYLAAVDGLAGWSVWERLSEIAAPTLIVAAELDYTPVALKQACADAIPRAECVVLPGTRHAAPAEQPGVFNQTLHAFLVRCREAG